MKALRLCALMIVQYFLVCANMRFVAQRAYGGTLTTDAAIAANGFMVTKCVVAADTWTERFAYVVGGCVGSALALYFT